jgi:hypothetical protein
VDLANQEVTGPLRRKEDQGLVEDITNTPKRIHIGENTVSQVHPLLGIIIGMGWMSYEEK